MRLWILFVVTVALGLVWAVGTRLLPPSQMVMAAGPDGGAYAQIAQQYRDILARDGISLEIRESAGSQENAGLLANGEVDAAILQGGISVLGGGVEAIGSIFYEPMFFLSRAELEVPSNPALWRGFRINRGQDGSGTAAVFEDFRRAVGLSANSYMSLGYAEAIAALSTGDLDIAVFVAPIDAPYLLDAYARPEIRFLELDYSEAVARRLTYANTVSVPAGGMSLDPVRPLKAHRLMALEARMAISDRLHPALVNRLTMAAMELHGARGLITDPETFPSVDGAMLPINNAARQLITEGPSTWFDWLPYWVAAQINRVLLLLLPVIFLVLPLLRLLPGVYAYFMRWRVWQYYPEIRQIEEDLFADPAPEELRRMALRLQDVDDRLAHLRLPAAYRQRQYDARLHIEMIQNRISALLDGQTPELPNVVPISTGP